MKLTVASDVWRLLSELDLDAIRVQALRPFRLLLLAQDADLAAEIASALSGGRPHPWLITVTPGAVPQPPAADEPAPELAVVAFRGEQASPELRAAQAELAARGLTVIVHGFRHRIESGAGPMGATSDDLLEGLTAALVADRRLAYARALPPLRERVGRRLIDETARANATYAFTAGLAENVPVLGVPLTVADMVVLTKNQLMMAYRLALCAGKDGAPTDVLGEFVGVLGGGFLFRQASRQLVGLIPIVGLPAKVAVAYAGTVAVGRAALAWATHGDKLSPSALRGHYREAKERGLALFRDLRKGREGSPAS